MPDFETGKSGRVGEGRFGMLPDMPAQFALQNRFEKRADFLFLARREKFHPAVAQIPDGAGHIKAFGDLPDRIAEADSLDVALVKDLNGCAHANGRFIRRRGNCQRDLLSRRRRGQVWIRQILGRRNQARIIRIQIELFRGGRGRRRVGRLGSGGG
jgi:hypothetical protein